MSGGEDSPPDVRSRPADNHRTASKSDIGDADTPRIREAEDNLAQMKRRREAAWRLPPLPTGYRDPQFGYQRDGAA